MCPSRLRRSTQVVTDIDIDIDIEGLLYNTIDGLLRVLQNPRHHGVTLYCWVQGWGSAFQDRLP
eukprot:COSAG02_NODE_2231_length_9435_cov_5.634854_9_plen_64_part_00